MENLIAKPERACVTNYGTQADARCFLRSQWKLYYQHLGRIRPMRAGEHYMSGRRFEQKIAIATVILLIIMFINLPFAFAETTNWSPDTQLTTDPGWDVDPSIFQTADGTIWIAWASDREGVQNDVYYKASADNGVTWTGDIRLTFAESAEDIMPSIIQTGDGTIWVFWASDRTGNFELFYKASADNGSSWTVDTQLTTNSSRDISPSIMQQDNGTIWVVWHRDMAGNYDLFYRTFTGNGSTWSPEKRLTTDPSWDLRPSIIQAVDGTIWIAWASYRTGDFEIFYKTSTDGGISWSPETQLTTDKYFDEAPSIIQARDGSFWVAWQSDRKGTQYDIYYKTSPDNGSTWSSDTQLTTDPKDDMSPTIMNSHEGIIWIAWTSARTGDFEIFYTRTLVHDVAVINVYPSKPLVGQGNNLHIHVTVTNEGDFTETFDVTAYANTTVIETQEINLASGDSTTITFTWSTTGFAKGNYIISACATPLTDEIDTDDNTYADGTAMVTVSGDADGDFDVDLDDMFAVLISYGLPIDHPDYVPYADMDDDGTVDLDDMYQVLVHYGGTT